MKSHSVEIGGDRLDKYMMQVMGDMTRAQIQSLIKSQEVFVNKRVVKPSYILKDLDVITYNNEISSKGKSQSESISAEEINIRIIYEDDSIIVVDKQPGIVVHPGSGNKTGTLLNGLINKINVSGFQTNPGIVHRLDKETSGVMVVAKNHSVHRKISLQFEERTVNKTYYAFVWGDIDSSGKIEGNIIRKKTDRKSFVMTNGEGRYSKTTYKKIQNFGPVSYVELKPETGRTHQIRVHMKSIGHPIISDSVYSGGISKIKSFHVKYVPLLKNIMRVIPRVALHAGKIEISHPANSTRQSYSADLPNDMSEALDILNKYEQV